jgi:hypothetical protein
MAENAHVLLENRAPPDTLTRSELEAEVSKLRNTLSCSLDTISTGRQIIKHGNATQVLQNGYILEVKQKLYWKEDKGAKKQGH